MLIAIGNSGDQELMPLSDMARRFSLRDVGRSASVFDEEKLAWVNRHYLKDADQERLARLSLPYLERAGYVTNSHGDAVAYIQSLVPIFHTSVDRLEQVPQRLRQIFEFSATDALSDAHIKDEVSGVGARAVITALAEELRSAGRIEDREGEDFDSLQAALIEARLAAREIMAEDVRKGQIDDSRQFEIVDAQGQLVARIPFSDAFV